MKKTPFFVLSSLLLSGCALPLPVQVALWAADGISYLETEKSLSDHGISIATGQDCAVWRVLPEGRVCREAPPDVMVAELPDLTPSPKPAPAEDAVVPLQPATGAGPAAEPESEVREEPDSGNLMFVLRDVNMRNRPSGRSKVIRPLLRHEIAERVEARDGWLRVRVEESSSGESSEGWVDGRYLQAAG